MVRHKWLGVFGLGALFFAHTAQAQLVVGPAVMNKKAERLRSTVQRALDSGLAGVDRSPLTKDDVRALAECGNSVSCVSEITRQVGGRHVLHTIVGRKGNKVKAQLTLIDAKSEQPVEKARVSTSSGKSAVRKAIRKAAKQIAAKVKTLKPDETKPMPIAGAGSLGTPKPEPKAEPKPEPEPEIAQAPQPEPEPMATTLDSSPPLTATTTVDEEDEGANIPAYVTAGAGILAVGGGVLFMLLANSDANSRDETPQIEVDTRKDLNDSAFMKQGLGLGLLIGGGVALATGATMELAGIRF